MSKLNGNQCEGFSLYYNGESSCASSDGYEACVWAAEKLSVEKKSKTASSFLANVVKNLVEIDVRHGAMYIAEYPFCTLDQRVKIADKFGIADQVLFAKPKGRTLFEFLWEGTFVPERGGRLLYQDGRIYRMFGCSFPESDNSFILEKTDKDLADRVKKEILDGWDEINALPSKIDCDGILDGGFCHFKFSSKRCGGYEPLLAKEGKALKKWAKKIAKHFKKVGIDLELE